MSRYYLLILGLILILYEFYKVSKALEELNEEENFSIEFHNNLITFSQSNDEQLFIWLLQNSNKLQLYMGQYGIMAEVIPPYANYKITNYQIIVNGVNELPNEIRMNHLLNNKSYQYTEMMINSIRRYSGTFSPTRQSLSNARKNPIKLFLRGTKRLISIPFMILNQFEIISNSLYDKIIVNKLFKFCSGIIALLGFLSAIITVVLGWDEFIILINNFFNIK